MQWIELARDAPKTGLEKRLAKLAKLTAPFTSGGMDSTEPVEPSLDSDTAPYNDKEFLNVLYDAMVLGGELTV